MKVKKSWRKRDGRSRYFDSFFWSYAVDQSESKGGDAAFSSEIVV